MAARPVLGIIACNRQIGEEIAQSVINRYIVSAMRYADCAAVIIPSLPEYMHAGEVLSRVDGVLLTGSPSNVEPIRYRDAVAGDGPFDRERDQMAMDLVAATLECSKPLFGICRGFQEINVALGGTLRRDLGDERRDVPHHAPADVSFSAQFDHQHEVVIAKGGLLEAIYPNGRAAVNSVHFQGIDRLADTLEVEAVADDGVVEAYSARPNGAPLLAVQWHPEWSADQHGPSERYFQLLGYALRGEL
jgi:putative glutamine amidotransferase